MPRFATWAAVAALALSPGGALGGAGSPSGPPGSAAAKAGGAGRVTFRQGGKAFRLPLETADIELAEHPSRKQYHVSLVYRDAKNRTFAIAFVAFGPGPVPDRQVSDLTVSTPAGLSKLRPGASACNLVVSALDPSRAKGRASCRGLGDFGGERPSPDVTEVEFTASR
jgi:hypothetical protein